MPDPFLQVTTASAIGKGREREGERVESIRVVTVRRLCQSTELASLLCERPPHAFRMRARR